MWLSTNPEALEKDIWVRCNSADKEPYFYFQKLKTYIKEEGRFYLRIGTAINYVTTNIYECPNYCEDRKLEDWEIVLLKLQGTI